MIRASTRASRSISRSGSPSCCWSSRTRLGIEPNISPRLGLKELLGGGPPRIAVSFADQSTEADIARLRAEGIDVAELRIDRFSSLDTAHVLSQARRFADFPTIATIRTEREGGLWSGEDPARLSLFKAVMPHVDGVDIELSSTGIVADVVADARSQKKVVIVSSHDFETTPSEESLQLTAERARAVGADLVKIAAMAKSYDDLRTLAAFTLAKASSGVIVIAMGDFGTSSRVFFPALGSRLTYSYLDSPVPGQMSFAETFAMLVRFYPDFNQSSLVQ